MIIIYMEKNIKYKQKYLKYKQKYLLEKNQLYGGSTAATTVAFSFVHCLARGAQRSCSL